METTLIIACYHDGFLIPFDELLDTKWFCKTTSNGVVLPHNVNHATSISVPHHVYIVYDPYQNREYDEYDNIIVSITPEEIGNRKQPSSLKRVDNLDFPNHNMLYTLFQKEKDVKVTMHFMTKDTSSQ